LPGDASDEEIDELVALIEQIGCTQYGERRLEKESGIPHKPSDWFCHFCKDRQGG
jgi:hypothetical protein